VAKYGSVEYYWQNASIYIGNAGRKGKGVFTHQDIKKGDWFEVAPVLLLKEPYAVELDPLFYEWDEETWALAMGFGSFYNHSASPNVEYYLGTLYRCRSVPVIGFKALRDIKEGEELSINYNGDPADKTPWVFGEDDEDTPNPDPVMCVHASNSRIRARWNPPKV